MGGMTGPSMLNSNPIWGSPLLHIGLGLLGQSGPSRQPRSPFAGALGGMHSAQQAQLGLAQIAEARRREEEFKRQQIYANALAAGNYTPEAMRAMAGQAYPGMAAAQAFKDPKTTNAEQLYNAMGGQAGTGKSLQDWYLEAYKGGGVNVNVGTEGPQFPTPPTGQYRPDPTQPGLEPEPGYVSTQDRQAQAKQGQQQQVLKQVRGVVQRYRDLVAAYGVEVGGKGAAQLEAAQTQAILALKEAAKLGALQGPDLDLMLSQLQTVTGFRGAASNLLGGGQAKALAALDETLRGLQQQQAGTGNEAYTGAPVTVRSDADYEKLSSGTVFVGPDGVARRKP